jgi:hypothetical protein
VLVLVGGSIINPNLKENVRKSSQENPSYLPRKRWDETIFRPTYPGGTEVWLAAVPLAARPPAAPAPPAPLSASFGCTAMLPNPASLAGDDASAARYTPQRTHLILLKDEALKRL